ncbi:MAG: aldehyde dehydrogenase family protein [Pseudomonadota bacterium]
MYSLPELRTDVARFIEKSRPMLVGDRWHEVGRSFAVRNPATGDTLAEVADGSAVEVDMAVAEARRAFRDAHWRRMAPAERTDLLWKLADLLIANADELVQMEVLNQGKPLELATHLDVHGSAETLRYYAGWCTKLEGTTLDISFPDFRGEGAQGPAYHAYSAREPIGVVGAIVPWNVPLVMAIAKLAPALTAGCTVVLRPSEATPLTTLRLGELILEADFPPGVVNIVTGDGPEVPSALASHMDVDMVAFTGSTVVGRKIVEAAAHSNLKRVALELGGNRPVIVCADADLDAAAGAALDGLMVNAGQMCFAGSRLLVERPVFDEFMERVAALAKNMKVGPGWDPDTELGPLISEQQRDRVGRLVSEALARPEISCLAGGRARTGSGYFFEPTVLSCPDHDAPIVREEVFGPVLTGTPFDSADEVMRLADTANDTEYGLTASLWTKDLSRAHRLAAEIQSGMVWINCAFAFDEGLPFGGYKQSGWGREGSRLGVDEYMQAKSVIVAL